MKVNPAEIRDEFGDRGVAEAATERHHRARRVRVESRAHHQVGLFSEQGAEKERKLRGVELSVGIDVHEMIDVVESGALEAEAKTASEAMGLLIDQEEHARVREGQSPDDGGRRILGAIVYDESRHPALGS